MKGNSHFEGNNYRNKDAKHSFSTEKMAEIPENIFETSYTFPNSEEYTDYRDLLYKFTKIDTNDPNYNDLYNHMEKLKKKLSENVIYNLNDFYKNVRTDEKIDKTPFDQVFNFQKHRKEQFKSIFPAISRLEYSLSKLCVYNSRLYYVNCKGLVHFIGFSNCNIEIIFRYDIILESDIINEYVCSYENHNTDDTCCTAILLNAARGILKICLSDDKDYRLERETILENDQKQETDDFINYLSSTEVLNKLKNFEIDPKYYRINNINNKRNKCSEISESSLNFEDDYSKSESKKQLFNDKEIDDSANLNYNYKNKADFTHPTCTKNVSDDDLSNSEKIVYDEKDCVFDIQRNITYQDFLENKQEYDLEGLKYILIDADTLFDPKSRLYTLLNDFSLKEDNFDTDYMFDRVNKQAEFLDEQPFYSANTLKFFANRKEKLNINNFNYHQKAARLAFIDTVKGFKNDFQELEKEKKIECREKILRVLNDKKTQVFESDIRKFRGFTRGNVSISNENYAKYLKKVLTSAQQKYYLELINEWDEAYYTNENTIRYRNFVIHQEKSSKNNYFTSKTPSVPFNEKIIDQNDFLVKSKNYKIFDNDKNIDQNTFYASKEANIISKDHFNMIIPDKNTKNNNIHKNSFDKEDVSVISQLCNNDIIDKDNKYTAKKHDDKISIIENGEIITSVKEAAITHAINLKFTDQIDYNDRLDDIRVHEKIIEENKRYILFKEIRDLSIAPNISEYSEICKKNSLIHNLQMRRICKETNFSYHLKRDILAYKRRYFDINAKLRPEIPINLEKYETVYGLSYEKGKIDPDNLFYLSELGCQDLVPIFLASNIYQELQKKRNISNNIFKIRCSNIPFRIKDLDEISKHYEVCLKGNIHKNDGGVCYVSYFENNNLIRTEKWRKPDLYNYRLGDSKLIVLAIGLFKRNIPLNTIRKMIEMYGTIISENSWEFSKVLKVFRYVSYGFSIDNPFLEKSVDKFIKVINSDKGIRRSYALLYDLFYQSDFENKTTILFDLPLDMISWEVFMMNLGAKNFYGYKKHLCDSLKELNNEIDLFESNKNDISNLYKEFDEIITLNINNFSNNYEKENNFEEKLNYEFGSMDLENSIISAELEQNNRRGLDHIGNKYINDYKETRTFNYQNIESKIGDSYEDFEMENNFNTSIFEHEKDNLQNLAKEIQNDFLHLLISKYKTHIENIFILSFKTKQRFTFSPFSILLICEIIDKLNINYNSLEIEIPGLEDLMKNKASYDSVEMEISQAEEAIKNLSKKLCSQSSSIMAINLIDKNIADLTMRMNSKEQIGGNREISIMSSEMRLLQSIVEEFFRNINKYIENEFTDDPNKMAEYIKSMQAALSSDYVFSASIDQTRWGPNFNTAAFGLMALCMIGDTCEAYLPAMILFFCEFKVFETCPWLTQLFNKISAGYSLPGRVGRYHMGQGIFTRASSTYHSLVTKFIQKIYLQLLSLEDDILEIFHHQNSFINNDDSAICEFYSIPKKDICDNQNANYQANFKCNYHNNSDKYAEFRTKTANSIESNITDMFGSFNIEQTSNNRVITVDEFPNVKSEILQASIERDEENTYINKEVTEKMIKIKNLYSHYDKLLLLFGIKTSEYKNSFSSKMNEFLSQYIGKDFISHNDIKFISSCLDTQDHDDIESEIGLAIHSYKATYNNGVSEESAMAIAKMNYIMALKKWGIDPRKFKMITNEEIKTGLNAKLNYLEREPERKIENFDEILKNLLKE